MTQPAPPKPRRTRSAKTTADAAKPRSKPRPARSAAVRGRGTIAAADKGPAARLGQVASTVVTSRQRNAQALVEAGRQSYSGVAEVLKRRLVILQETLSELRAVAKVMRQAGARESVAHLDGLARGAMQLTVNSIRELSALASATQKEALDILARRLQADLVEFRQLRSKRSTAD